MLITHNLAPHPSSVKLISGLIFLFLRTVVKNSSGVGKTTVHVSI